MVDDSLILHNLSVFKFVALDLKRSTRFFSRIVLWGLHLLPEPLKRRTVFSKDECSKVFLSHDNLRGVLHGLEYMKGMKSGVFSC